jgi:hypothetical protein
MRAVLATALPFLIAVQVGAQPVDSVIAQQGSPVYVRSLDTEASTSGTSLPSRVEFYLMYSNIEAAEVKAVRFGMVSVSPFGDILGFSTWTEVGSITPYNEVGTYEELDVYLSTPVQNAHYSGVVYVDRVLMADGREGRANMDSVRAKIERAVGRPGFSLPDDTTSASRSPEI